MSRLDFHIDYNVEVGYLPPDLEGELADRLTALCEGHDDMIGAAVAIEELAHEETAHVFEVRLVAYIRPNNLATTEKDSNLTAAVRGALSALERQVRGQREKLGRPWKQPSNVLGELNSAENTSS